MTNQRKKLYSIMVSFVHVISNAQVFTTLRKGYFVLQQFNIVNVNLNADIFNL